MYTLESIKTYDSDKEFPGQRHFIVKGNAHLYHIQIEEVNKWYKNYLKELSKADDFGTEDFENFYPEEHRGTIVDAIEKYVIENVDCTKHLESFITPFTNLKRVQTWSHTVGHLMEFEITFVDGAPF